MLRGMIQCIGASILTGVLMVVACGVGATCFADPPSPPPAVAPFDQKQATSHQTAWAKYLKRDPTITNSVGIKLVLIPPGEFTMGSPQGETEREDDELQHRVRLTKPTYIGECEVTQEQYQKVMRENPSSFSPLGNDKERAGTLDTRKHPVESVSWARANDFCERLSELEQRSGLRYRLPTEAEWEYAARAGSASPFPWGDKGNGREANCDGEQPYGTTKKGPALYRPSRVGSYAANAFGLYDTNGNVNEWCSDLYGRDSYKNSTPENPKGPKRSDFFPPPGVWHVIRGGNYMCSPAQCRSADRYYDFALSGNTGFRVVADLERK